MLISSNDVQPLNVSLGIAVRLCGRDILVIAPEDANALFPITRVPSRTV